MPFTPAHPAIVLPLLRNRYFSATGLIVGSVTPDFEYFFKASVSGVHGHTLWGLFYFDLPVGIALSWVFHEFVKQSFIGNLPLFLQVRLQPLLLFNFKTYLKNHTLIVCLSILLGSFSHIFWDSFTHNGRFFVELLSVLKSISIPYDGANYPLWYVLQHVSTVIGLMLISIYVFRMERNPAASFTQPNYSYWVALLILSGVLFCIRFTVFTAPFELGNIVVTAMSAVMASICLMGLFFKWFQNRKS